MPDLPPQMTPKQTQRVWMKVLKSKSDGCWLWIGSRNEHGYGGVRINDRLYKAHRVVYWLSTGVDPGPRCVLHRCDNPPCVNPAHLFLGTKKENSEDMARKGRSTLGERNPARLYPSKHHRGEMCYNAKLTEEIVRAIRRRRADGLSYSKLAAEFGICPMHAYDVANRRKWAHVL
jgi:hypothetical protein